VSKKQIEFNECDCEMILITDRTSEMQLSNVLREETKASWGYFDQIHDVCLKTSD
jgi:uncharacterized protein with von Willebrand factor type A (vWA) domain